ncbi:MAG TPA: DEAD/DEAH box helicase [Burkholderiaceae bacterium]|nr:DEAD/DEAH box helicase [Burkholderiaceae bacterium]
MPVHDDPAVSWRPPVARYPQRPDDDERRLQGAFSRAWAARLDVGTAYALRVARAFVKRVRAVPREQGEALAADPRAIRVRLAEAVGASADAREAALVDAFAAVAAVSRRVLGLDPHDTQTMAARLLLDGCLAEMATGEGKTLVVAMAATIAALGGWRVHVMTANDYLAERDAERIQPLASAFGIGSACVLSNDTEDERRAAYRQDIVYTTAKEVAFDWLRDRVRFGRAVDDLGLSLRGSAEAPPLLTGLAMALVDEADSLLLDEARTPLILAERVRDERIDDARLALQFASRLKIDRDFELEEQQVLLTDGGQLRINELARGANARGLWAHASYRQEQVALALAAMHVYARNVDYVVRDGEVVIVDVNTGRIAEGRRWSRGLHRLIELKEGLAPQDDQRTLASVTFPRFFARYWRLGGTSGTLHSARAELNATYRLRVVRVPLHKPSKRRVAALRVFVDSRTHMQMVVSRAHALVTEGRPVLIGTDSVEASEQFARVLREAGHACVVLNALQDAVEADVVARAGEAGRITVSTAMAGRGTDIGLGPGVAERGGLAVLMTNLGRSARIDNQLLGRAGRHGEPGSVEKYITLNDKTLLKNLGHRPMWWLRLCAGAHQELPRCIGISAAWVAQTLQDARDAGERRAALRDDLARDASVLFGAIAR